MFLPKVMTMTEKHFAMERYGSSFNVKTRGLILQMVG
jgi:hypothetical protein